jgi:hypothetical protein
MHQEYLDFKFVFTIALVSKQNIEKQFWRFSLIRPNLEVRPYLPSQNFHAGCLQEGTRVLGANVVGLTEPSGTTVPMISTNPSSQPLQAFKCSTHHKNEDTPTR